MNKEIRKQLKGYKLTKKILDERFKGKKFKTDTGAGTLFYYDALYYGNDCISPDEYKLHELVDWIKTLLGTGANVHHPILYHINKEKAVEVVNEIIQIIREDEEKTKQKIEKHYNKEYTIYDMVESSKDWPIIDKMKKQEEENMKNEKKCNCEKGCKCKKEPIKQKATLKLADGREIEVEISKEELKKLQVKKNPYDQVKKNERIYFMNSCGVIEWTPEDCEELGIAAGLKGNINYYNDKTAAENDARADLLMRKLRKFAVENNKPNDSDCIFAIYFDELRNNILPQAFGKYNSGYFSGVVKFSSEDICQKAIIDFYDELKWYFTEYLKIYE